MLIIGNIPDLFDHMPYVYGVDNKIVFDKRVYNDLPKKTINTIDSTSYCADLSFTMHNGFDRDYYIENKLYDSWKYTSRRKNPYPLIKYSLYSFFYCGRIYLVARKLTRNDIRGIVDHYDALNEYFFVTNDIDGEPYYIDANQSIMDYAKEQNIPFFIYHLSKKKHNYITVMPHINYVPLYYIKHTMFDDVNVVYNDIYNHMLSYLNDDDIVQVSNEDKIKQAGFDLKTSFRKM